MKTVIFTLATLFFALVCAQTNTSAPFFITSPLQSDTYKAGASIHIAWRNGVDQSVLFDLIAGTDPTSMQVTNFGFDVDGSNDEYDWTLPTKINSQDMFAFQITYKDDSGATVYAYSDQFSITGGTVTAAVSSAVSTTISAATTAIPSTTTSTTGTISNVVASATGSPSPSPTKSSNGAGPIQSAASLMIFPAVLVAALLG